MANLERIYTIPLGDAYLRVRNKRAKRAVAFVRAFALRHMKASEVKISEGTNSLVFRDGMQKPPRKLKVRIVKGEEGIAKVWLIGEEERIKAAADKKKSEEAAKKAEEEKEQKRKDDAKKAADQKKKDDEAKKAAEQKKADTTVPASSQKPAPAQVQQAQKPSAQVQIPSSVQKTGQDAAAKPVAPSQQPKK